MAIPVKVGDIEFRTKNAAKVIGKITNVETSQVNLYKWYVTASDCNKQMGKVVTLSIDGTFLFENDFVIGSGTIATAMAEAICNSAANLIKTINDKSL